jgi:hypothetical protein
MLLQAVHWERPAAARCAALELMLPTTLQIASQSTHKVLSTSKQTACKSGQHGIQRLIDKGGCTVNTSQLQLGVQQTVP